MVGGLVSENRILIKPVLQTRTRQYTVSSKIKLIGLAIGVNGLPSVLSRDLARLEHVHLACVVEWQANTRRGTLHEQKVDSDPASTCIVSWYRD